MGFGNIFSQLFISLHQLTLNPHVTPEGRQQLGNLISSPSLGGALKMRQFNPMSHSEIIAFIYLFSLHNPFWTHTRYTAWYMRSNRVLSSGNSPHCEGRDRPVKNPAVECIMCPGEQLSQGRYFPGIFTDEFTNQRSEGRAPSSFLYSYHQCPLSSRPLLSQTPRLLHNTLSFPQALFTHFVGQKLPMAFSFEDSVLGPGDLWP